LSRRRAVIIDLAMKQFWWLVAGVLVGCKVTAKTADVQSRVQRSLEANGLDGTVTCPRTVPAKAGTSFECTATIDDHSYVLAGTIDKIDGTDIEVSARFKDGAPVLAHKIVALSAGMTRELGPGAKLDCGEPLRFLDAKRQVACALHAGTVTANAVFTFDDKLAIADVHFVPDVFMRHKLEKLVAENIVSKLPNATVACQMEPVALRPVDDVLWCEATVGDRKHKLKVEIQAADQFLVKAIL
jgi:type 1 fimbria pilin